MMPNPDFFIVDEALSAAEANLCEHHPRVNRLIRSNPAREDESCNAECALLESR